MTRLIGALLVLLPACGSDHDDLLGGNAGAAGSQGVKCASSAECSGATAVCDEVTGVCVQCLFDTQCAAGLRCENKACVAVAACNSNVDCPDARHCEGGECVIDVCQAGAAKCVNNAVVVCLEDGSSWGAPQVCPSGTSCKNEGTQAGCAAAGTCTAGAVFCEGLELRQCNDQGAGSQLIATCMQGQVCDAAAKTCQSAVCSPFQAVCQGNVAVVCNADGTGYLPGGTDCAAQGKTCEAGTCVGGCSGTSPDGVRMVEAFLGTDDYIVLENRGACPAQIAELWLRIEATDPANDFDFDLPPRMLNPGERVYVSDPLGAKTGDISLGSNDNIFFTYDSGANALLCKGSCYSGQVLDFFSHGSGAQPPPPPPGVTFTPAPVTGVSYQNENTHSYVRMGFSGSFPSFKSTDWTLAPASRPWENPSSCPATQPSGTNCTPGDICIYGGVTCTCMPLFGWSCS